MCLASDPGADNFVWSWQPQGVGSIQIAGPLNASATYSCDTEYGVYLVEVTVQAKNNGVNIGAKEKGFTCNL